jgi:hypothetical protein
MQRAKLVSSAGCLAFAMWSVLMMSVAAQVEAQSASVYRIQSRWIGERHLRAEGGNVQSGAAEGNTALWAVQPVGGAYLIRHSSGRYLGLAADSDALSLSTARPSDDRGRWFIEPVGQFVTIRNVATGRFVNIEKQPQPPDAALDKTPNDKNWWSGQWRMVHVSGPRLPMWRKAGQVIVTEPAYGSTIRGDTTLKFSAPGLHTATVSSWLPEGDIGRRETIGEVELDEAGHGSIVFPADRFPRGPMSIRVSASHGSRTSNYYLMVYNEGGVSWHQGAPSEPPPQAEGMKLVFIDEFDKPELSISRDGRGTTYTSHKPGGGDFSTIPFSDHENKQTTPFSQRDTYLRIRIDQHKNTAGLISALRMDGTGITVNAPCYFECRFIAQTAPGTWPAFWVMTQDIHKGLREPVDELDIIEAYGGEGPGHPNQTGYWIASHYWNQGPNGGKDYSQPRFYDQIKMTELGDGNRATWYETFHTYGVLVGEEDTIYYCDNIEVARHKTARLSGSRPLFFFINFATGGGWPVDLSQYDGIVDMYVDFVRVYEKQ